MRFNITQEIDVEAELKGKLISSLSDDLAKYLKNKKYGVSISNFLIGCVCVKTRPEYEDWFKIRKPKYKEVEKLILLDGSIDEMKGVYSYDIQLDFDKFINNTDENSVKLLVNEILSSMSHLDKLPKKVKDFDKDSFLKDIKEFLRKKF